MKMAIDVHLIASAIKSGAYSYTYNLVLNLLKRKNVSLELTYFDKNKERGHRKIIDDAFLGRGDFTLRECNDHKASDFFGELNYFLGYDYGDCLKIDSEISHFTFEYRVCEPTLYKQRAIVTLFDTVSLDINMTQRYFRHEHQQLIYQASIIRKDRIERLKPLQIITDSDYAKSKIMELFPQFHDRINATHLSYDADTFYPDKSNDKISRLLDSEFIFWVGNGLYNKNLSNIIKSFEVVADKNKYLKLVLSGIPFRSSKSVTAFNDALKSRHRNRIIFTGVISEDELRQMYSNAIFTPFVPLHEGSGVTILEAQACGCPVITSNCTACPETAGDSAIPVDPYDVESIADAMERILNDSRLREDLRTKGFENIKRFSWDKCAAETEEVYRKAYEMLRAKD